ncbi:pyridoxamine 5'-phosphate oxidase family protein [Deinococcus aquaticus]|uniref:Pyridoxamine 5'-phosphate oxidase family protein n=1 Tax=Deinococcus aquaticus TaxID=328692 RepID=A0ABY7UX39_9DEIO|nr:pyridoxamine 5'-phosphate oxidase family protein [Deinococcus aquaticus]WDA57469.1 pyridoxamine 5'-phosphate oxidase family protein [Deinococcus aquaticus]
MAKQLPGISDHLRAFIEAQHLFFAGTAAPDGRVNVSPKGLDSLRVLGPNRVAWLNVTGSGNETAAHLRLIRIPSVSLTTRDSTGLPTPRPESALLPLASARMEWFLQTIPSESVSARA